MKKQSNINSKIAIAVVFIAIIGGLVFYYSNSSSKKVIASQTKTQAIDTNGQVQIIKHAQGETQIPISPSRVAVFDLAALSVLDALGVENIIGVAGANDMPPKLSKYQNPKYSNLGTLFEPNYEIVNSIKPDLIIVGGRSSAKYKELSAIAPTIDMASNYNKPVENAISNVKLLSGIFNKNSDADKLIQKLQTTIAGLKQKTANRGNGLIVLVTGGKISAYGAGSRFGIIHTDFGVPQAVDGLETSLHGEAINSEFIQKTNPNWLFVIDRDAAIGQAGAAKQVIENPLVKTTNAWKNNQIIYLNPTPWYLMGDGIVAVQDMADEINRAYNK